jgi:hypothetical protein
MLELYADQPTLGGTLSLLRRAKLLRTPSGIGLLFAGPAGTQVS